MRLEQVCWSSSEGWEVRKSELQEGDRVQLVLVFGDPDLIKVEQRFQELRERYPRAHIVGGSTAGNVLGAAISDDDIVATAVSFEKSKVKLVKADIQDSSGLREAVLRMMSNLQAPDLRHVLVISDGIHFNGSDVANGINEYKDIPVTGGLLGDNGRFEETYTIADEPAKSNRIALVGFYGDHLHIGHGCFAGWREFGIDRIITKSTGNVVFEIDSQPALALYRKYLGELAAELPAIGLRFPLSIRNASTHGTLIRTLLNINEDDQSLIFAGDVPEGSTSVLMKANIDGLVDGAGQAAKQAVCMIEKTKLAVVISCVGRKILMGQMTDEELEIVRRVLGETTWMTGFYSYGELSSSRNGRWQCQLHNQTMTLMSMCES